MRTIDADALTDEIRKYANDPVKLRDRRWDARCKAIIADMIGTVKTMPTIGGWISAKRPPEKDGDYLTRLRHGGMKVMGFTHDLRKVDDYHFRKKKPGWYEYDSEWGFYERNDITHYMPLPEPPKEVAE